MLGTHNHLLAPRSGPQLQAAKQRHAGAPANHNCYLLHSSASSGSTFYKSTGIMAHEASQPRPGSYGKYADLQGKRVLVTGGSAGIGRAAALAFGANGARVAVMGRRKERLDAVVEHLPTGLAVVGDLTVPEDCKRAVAETVEAFGGLDVLVNNGAVSTAESEQHALEPQGYEAQYRLHVSSFISLVKAAEEELIQSKGNIVNVNSVVSKSTPSKPPSASYYVAKAAQLKLTEGYARQFAQHGVRVNSVLPGWVQTEFIDHLAENAGVPVEKVLEKLGPVHALGRVSHPDEQAAGILFLASEAASFVTGTELLMDGGGHLMRETAPDLAS